MPRVFNILTKDAPPSGFANITKGKGSERVYGLAQCRGDVDQEDCKACIHNSTEAVVGTYSPSAIDAIIWYENCQLCYSNTNFFARLNVEDSGSWYWTADKVEEPKAFNQNLGSLMKNLISQVTTEPNSKFLFATGNIPSTNQKTIYGLVQCTRGTSLADCSQCLISTISQIPSTCDNAHGCEIAIGSCRVRFDTQIFYNSTTTPSPPAPPSNSSLSPSPLLNSSPPSNPSPPSSGASNTTSG
ncbi:cysteine-rich repeat secretory protein 38-like [Nymphaea colorata]|nr:cysteine-rich repeat secretory protein 38-like [Nymphaea colorata]